MAQIDQKLHETSPPDAFRLDDALGCGELSEAVREAIATGDWGTVARLADARDEQEAA